MKDRFVKVGVGPVTEPWLITGVSGWSSSISSSLVRIEVAVLGLGDVEYGTGRVLTGVEGPKERQGGIVLTGLLGS